jgi:hypothetical protein
MNKTQLESLRQAVIASAVTGAALQSGASHVDVAARAIAIADAVQKALLEREARSAPPSAAGADPAGVSPEELARGGPYTNVLPATTAGERDLAEAQGRPKA